MTDETDLTPNPDEEIIEHGPAATEEAPEDNIPDPEEAERRQERNRARRESRTRKKLENELSELRAQVHELRTGHTGSETKQALGQFDQAYVTARNQYQTALQSGNVAQITAANDRLLEAYSSRLIAYQRAEEIKERASRPAPQQAPVPTHAARKFIRDNDWLEDPDYAIEAAAVRHLDEQLSRDWDEDDIGSEDYIKELTRLAKDRVPKAPFRGASSGSAVRGQNVAGSRSTTGAVKQRLPQDLINAAKLMGRNTDDPAWRKAMLEKYMRKRA